MLEIILALVGLAIATPTAFETIFKAVDAISSKLERNRATVEFAREVRSLTLGNGKNQLRQDVALAQKICVASDVSAEQKATLEDMFALCAGLLRDIDGEADKVLRKADSFISRSRRSALAQLSRDTVRLKVAAAQFHDTVISMSMYKMLPSTVVLDQYDLVLYEQGPDVVSFGPGASIVRGRLSQARNNVPVDHEHFLVDAVTLGLHEQESVFVKKSLELLATNLLNTQIAQGILPFVGMQRLSRPDRFALIFQAEPQDGEGSLLSNLIQNVAKPSLSKRVHYCAILAETALHVHSVRLVHKNIRPSNIVIVPRPYPEPDRLLLLGWSSAKVMASQTLHHGETEFDKCTYQHPDRIMGQAEEDYCMGHDIYSLGVCMLEILLWESLLEMTPSGDNSPVSIAPSKAFLDILEKEKEGKMQDKLANNPGNVSFKGPGGEHMEIDRYDIQTVIYTLARTQLPPAVGERLTKAVLHCLTCLDMPEGESLAMAPFINRSQQDVAADFVDLVMKDLRQAQAMI